MFSLLKKIFQNETQVALPLPKYDYEVEFLKQISDTPFGDKPFDKNSYWLNRFGELKIDCHKLLTFFLGNGCLRITNKEEQFTVKELKLILQEQNLVVSGNKEALLERARKFINHNNYPRDFRRFYVLTFIGKDLIQEDSRRFACEYEIFFDNLIHLIKSNKLKLAIALEEKFRFLSVDQRGFGSVSCRNFKLSRQDIEIVTYFQKKPKLHFSNQSEPELTLILCSYALTKSFRDNYSSKKIANLLAIAGLMDFQKFYNSSLKDKFVAGDGQLAKSFLDFEYSFALNHIQLNNYMLESAKFFYQGIAVVQRCCEVCNQISDQNYYWQEINDIPKIPKEVNCTCTYLPIRN